jgi:hypothetical protein
MPFKRRGFKTLVNDVASTDAFDHVARNICQALHCGGQGFSYLSDLRGSIGGRCVRGGAGIYEAELRAPLSPAAAIACDLTQALSLERDCVDTNTLERFLPKSFDGILRSDTSLLGRVMPPQFPLPLSPSQHALPQSSSPPSSTASSSPASPSSSSFGIGGSCAATVLSRIAHTSPAGTYYNCSLFHLKWS